jgi:hypothetical protein
MTSNEKYLTTFFDEKELPYESWSLIDDLNQEHIIDTDYVKESIFAASNGEQERIANTIRQIDFKNGNVNHYLKFLAECIVKAW